MEKPRHNNEHENTPHENSYVLGLSLCIEMLDVKENKHSEYWCIRNVLLEANVEIVMDRKKNQLNDIKK